MGTGIAIILFTSLDIWAGLESLNHHMGSIGLYDGDHNCDTVWQKGTVEHSLNNRGSS